MYTCGRPRVERERERELEREKKVTQACQASKNLTRGAVGESRCDFDASGILFGWIFLAVMAALWTSPEDYSLR